MNALSPARLAACVLVVFCAVGASLRAQEPAGALPAVQAPAAATAPPTPAAFFGFEPGAERKLIDYDDIVAYFRTLAATSDRVSLATLGKTTEGNPFVIATISSSANMRRIEDIRQNNLKLATGNLTATESAGLIATAKTIVLLNASIHSNEVGPTQSTPVIAHFLATTNDPQWLAVLDNVVLLLNPCHNPDGCKKQVAWYRKNVGTPFESSPLPELYNRYVGHDNNRDWFMFTQVESKLTIDGIHARWRPQIVLDEHQMGTDGARMFIPPYEDPIEPHVPAELMANLASLGDTVRGALIARGCTGIVSRSLFDAWTPGRAYPHTHGGVRVLTEIASCNIATTVPARGTTSRGAASRAAPEAPTANNPAPWTGASWSLADVVRYNKTAALEALRHASANRVSWLTTFHDVLARQAAGTGSRPAAYEVANNPQDARAIAMLRQLMARGGVRVEDALNAEVGQDTFITDPVLVINAAQPFGAFAAMLMDNAPYPEIRDERTGSLKRPYDVTTHSIPLLFGLSVKAWPTTGTAQKAEPAPTPVDPRLENNALFHGDRLTPALAALDRTPGAKWLAIYQSFTAPMDEGWTRYFCDQFGIPFVRFRNEDIRSHLVERGAGGAPQLIAGGARVLVLPDQSANSIMQGVRGAMPPEYRGGIGPEGLAAIRDFVAAGGTLVTAGGSADFAITAFKLPITNPLAGLGASSGFNVPGSLLRLTLNTKTPVAQDMPAEVAAFYSGARAFAFDLNAPTETRPEAPPVTTTVLGHWAPADKLLMSGWGEGLDHLGGHAALVQCTVGRGKVLLFGFAPHFRFQTFATFPLFVRALG